MSQLAKYVGDAAPIAGSYWVDGGESGRGGTWAEGGGVHFMHPVECGLHHLCTLAHYWEAILMG